MDEKETPVSRATYQLEPNTEQPPSLDEALTALVDKVRPILDRIGAVVDSDNTNASLKITKMQARILTEWIVTIVNHNQLLEQQVHAAEQVVGQLDAKVKELNQGKGLWTPGPV
jgi:hypothetical protein